MTKVTKLDPDVAERSESDAIFGTPWHLCQTDEEIPVTMTEYSLLRTFGAFERWMAECQGAAAHLPMSSTDNLVLNAIRMREVPKAVSELARFLNRDDVSNIQYSLRKLQAEGLIEKVSPKKSRRASYQVTERGRKVTDEFARLRRELLIAAVPSLTDWEEQVATTRRVLGLMQSIYENASVSLMFKAPGDDSPG